MYAAVQFTDGKETAVQIPKDWKYSETIECKSVNDEKMVLITHNIASIREISKEDYDRWISRSEAFMKMQEIQLNSYLNGQNNRGQVSN